MASLGSLGKQYDPADVTFDWFGTEIRCSPEISDTVMIDFVEKGSAIDIDSPESWSVIKDFLRSCVHPDDFDTYWSLALKHRQQMDDHMDVMYALIEAAAGRPTGPPSVSADGPSQSGAESMASSLEQAFPGRPDLQAGVGQELIHKQIQTLRAV